ncbi:MAG: hydroxymethylglutaryl-CoA reductase, degradative [Bacteriovoracaceae bacterium]|nr:hydroxymethylglutaryl-CoA reductase, degradative [Bacteriovoracaceae bacterium]
MKPIHGFSKLSKLEKIRTLAERDLSNVYRPEELLKSFWHSDLSQQKIFDDFTENSISNFYFPYGVCPNLLLNDKLYTVPMVTEESSVVAAASKACKFWLDRGGFKAEVISTTKSGQVHLRWAGDPLELVNVFEEVKIQLLNSVTELTTNMEKRGGGLLSVRLIDRTADEPGYMQLWADFETCDAMGANFINSVLEALGQNFVQLVSSKTEDVPEVIMAILSNYSPECLVRVSVSCPIDELDDPAHGMNPQAFADKFTLAVRIATIDVNRATTHNKGIFNGIDAVILATGNDFRAVEACGHTYAARDGQYRSLSRANIDNGVFKFWIDIPMSVGTVGGLTKLHPLANLSLRMLGEPSAPELMSVAAALGLAQNFAALRSLVTSGIQKGHMKMHLMNILNHLEATDLERNTVRDFFVDKDISFNAVREYLSELRGF